MVGLFEQWDKITKTPEKNAFQKSYELIWNVMTYQSVAFLAKRHLSREAINQGQGFFICHIINYTGYNQKWNVAINLSIHTQHIWQGDRQDRKTGNWRKIQHNMRKVRRKEITPRLCSLGSTVWEQEKHLSKKSTYTIDTRLCNRGSNPAPASSHPVLQTFPALDRGWRGECISLYMSVCVCMCNSL